MAVHKRAHKPPHAAPLHRRRRLAVSGTSGVRIRGISSDGPRRGASGAGIPAYPFRPACKSLRQARWRPARQRWAGPQPRCRCTTTYPSACTQRPAAPCGQRAGRRPMRVLRAAGLDKGCGGSGGWRARGRVYRGGVLSVSCVVSWVLLAV